MGRAPCCDKAKVKKGPWSPEEDSKLKDFIQKFGTGGNWIALPQKAGLKRCGKSCRLRWLNYLRPNIKHGEFSDDEDRIICSLFSNIGSRWSIIAAHLPGRTDNDIKNYWNTKLKKKLMAMSPSQSQSRKPLQFPSSNHETPQFPYHHSLSSLYTKDCGLGRLSYSLYPSNKSFTGFEFDSIVSQIPSNLVRNKKSTDLAANSSLLVQEQEGTILSPTIQYYYPVKDHYNNLIAFGSTEASCSSNSDGSCGQICYGREIIKQEDDHPMGFQSHISSGYEENIQKFTLSYGDNTNNNNGGGGGHDHEENFSQKVDEKSNGYFGETQWGYHEIEDVKQLFSSSIENINNFLIDENKIKEKAMYYC